MHFNELRYQNPRTKTYLGSPSLARLPNGDLIATHDYFGPGCPFNHEGEEHLVSVYLSHDEGRSWHNVTHLANAYWSGLFVHRGSVYLLGVSQRYGSIVIRRSDDGGYTWTHPADEQFGLLFRGGSYRQAPNYHCAPVPVMQKDGRLYRAFEDCDPDVWGTGFKALVISADAESDLLKSASWRMSNKLAYDPAWTPDTWGEVENPGWLEGNMVEAPNGDLWNILRFNSHPVVDKAAMVSVRDEGCRLSFDPATGFTEFPGGMTKFTIHRDPATGLFLTLSNNNTDPKHARQRNILSLHKSANLLHWEHVQTLIQDDSDLTHQDSIDYVGFQYVDWIFDGADILYLVRTAYGGAHNYHDSNRITYHKIEDYRRLL